MPQLAEKERAVVGEQLEAAPDHDFLLNEPNGLVSDFARVETAYLQWLQNMHRAVHIFQHLRRTVDYYQWKQGTLDRKGRRFVRLLHQQQ